MDDANTWTLVVDSFLPLLGAGLTGTIPLALASFAIGLVLALAVALMRLSSNPVVSNIARFYISVIRGTPLLVQLFVIFYGLPSVGVVIDPWPAAIIAFSLNVGGYAAEVIRAAILSVPKGQWEAGHTVGFSHGRTLARIVLPQAARVSVPPLSNTFISLVKDSSLASLILVSELFRRGPADRRVHVRVHGDLPRGRVHLLDLLPDPLDRAERRGEEARPICRPLSSPADPLAPPAPADDRPLLEVTRPHEELRRESRARRCRLLRAARRGRGAHRSERVGEDHRPALAQRPRDT